MAIPKGRTLALGAAAALVGVPALAGAATVAVGSPTTSRPGAATGAVGSPTTSRPGAAMSLAATLRATIAAVSPSAAAQSAAPAAPSATPAVRDRALLVRIRGGELRRITVAKGLDPVAIAAELRKHPDVFTSAGADLLATASGTTAAADKATGTIAATATADTATAGTAAPTAASATAATATATPTAASATATAGSAAATAGTAAATTTASTATAATAATAATTASTASAAATETGPLATTPSTTPLPSTPGTTPQATSPNGVLVAQPSPVKGAATPVARIKGWIPDDHIGTLPWTDLQWNFVGRYGVNASEAWDTLRRRGSRYEGGKGVRVAVVDSGVAYRDHGVYRTSPDLPAGRILQGYDFVDDDRFPDDQSGHGTFVASTIAGATDNDAGVTGLAYDADIVPVRVLDDQDRGDVVAIARGIRYAVRRHATIINMSIDFPVSVTAADIPEVMSAIAYARSKGVLMIASSGNNGGNRVALPARSSSVLSVGASTVRGCRSTFSNAGPELDITAPGGGQDHSGEKGCHPNRIGPPIIQITILDPASKSEPPDPSLLGVPLDYVGTSMAAGHVTGVAALVAGSGVLGRNPSADLLAAYLVRSTRDLGTSGRDNRYGAGLIDAAQAVSRTGARSRSALRGARRAAALSTARHATSLPVL